MDAKQIISQLQKDIVAMCEGKFSVALTKSGAKISDVEFSFEPVHVRGELVNSWFVQIWANVSISGDRYQYVSNTIKTDAAGQMENGAGAAFIRRCASSLNETLKPNNEVLSALSPKPIERKRVPFKPTNKE